MPLMLQASSCWRQPPSWQECPLAICWRLLRRWAAAGHTVDCRLQAGAAACPGVYSGRLPFLPWAARSASPWATRAPPQGCVVRKAWVRPNFKQGGSTRRIQLASGSDGRAGEACRLPPADFAPGLCVLSAALHAAALSVLLISLGRAMPSHPLPA